MEHTINQPPSVSGGPDHFNALLADEAGALLMSCLAVPRWVNDVMSGRPFASVEAAVQVASASAEQLSEEEVEAALARHPRIGEPAGADHDADFSAREQAGVDPADDAFAVALDAGNRDYEDKFDRVFLIRAAGRSPDEILAEMHRRLDNSADVEAREVVEQLREIAVIRLAQVIAA